MSAQVFLVLDHERYTVAVYSSRKMAQGYIDSLERDEPAWQREMYGWQVEEMEVDRDPDPDPS